MKLRKKDHVGSKRDELVVRQREIVKKGWPGPRDQMRMEPMDVTAVETERQVLHTRHRDSKQTVQKISSRRNSDML